MALIFLWKQNICKKLHLNHTSRSSHCALPEANLLNEICVWETQTYPFMCFADESVLYMKSCGCQDESTCVSQTLMNLDVKWALKAVQEIAGNVHVT